MTFFLPLIDFVGDLVSENPDIFLCVLGMAYTAILAVILLKAWW